MFYGRFRINIKYINSVWINKIEVVRVGKNTQAKYMLVYLGRVPWMKAKIMYTTRYTPAYPARVLARSPLTLSTRPRYTPVYSACVLLQPLLELQTLIHDQGTRPCTQVVYFSSLKSYFHFYKLFFKT